jgi:hypothetical protein
MVKVVDDEQRIGSKHAGAEIPAQLSQSVVAQVVNCAEHGGNIIDSILR